MSAEHGYSALPSPLEERMPTPIRPDMPPMPITLPPTPTSGNLSFLRPNITLHPVLPSSEMIAEPISLPDWWPEKVHEPQSTALHESHHVLIGFSLGIPVEAVSIIPGSGYRGITIFSGNLEHNPDALQLIACGGAVNPSGRNAEGFGHHLLSGSDMHIAGKLSSVTGRSVEQSIEAAKKRLDFIDADVRKIVAGVIETLKYIKDPNQILVLINTAHALAQQKSHLVYENVAPETVATQRADAERLFEDSILAGDRTIFVTGEDGKTYYGIVTKKKDPFEESVKEFHCDDCTGEKTHADACKKKETTDKITSPRETDVTSLPIEAEVFDRKSHHALLT